MPLQEHFVKALYDTLPEPLVLVDTQRIIRSINGATSRKFGYDPAELLEKPVRLLYATDEDYDRCLNKPVVADRNGSVSETIHSFRRKDGSVFAARLRATHVSDAAGTPQGFIGIINDISEILELDKAHKTARDILDTALAAIPEGFAIFDKDERLLVYNEAYRRVCGPAGPYLRPGITATEIIHIAYRAGHYPEAPVGTAEAERWIENRMHDFRHPSGKPKIFPYGNGRWLRVENLKTDDGNTVVIRIDVTELKQTELALHRRQLEYYTLVQNIPDFITRISFDKRYTFANDYYCRFVGLSAQELIGRPFLDFVPENDRARVSGVLDALSPQRPLATAEQRRELADGGHIWLLWSNMAIFDNGALVEYVTVGRDITMVKDQQERIARQSSELQRKNDALNQFTGTVSHDLKAPLRHIAMFSDMIGEDLENGDLAELPVYAAHLRQSARRMDRLIDSLLDYSQIAYQIGNWSVVSLTDVVSDAVLNLDSLIREAGAAVEIGALPNVRGDPELLKRLAQNLIGNAVKYRRDGVAPVVRVYADSAPDAVRLSVEDNGIGIDARFAHKIFDVFQRLHRDESVYQGTGIGLALAKRIVESHNGTIELDTTFLQGARFIVTFPKNAEAGKE